MSHLRDFECSELAARIRAMFDGGFGCALEIRGDTGWEPRILACRGSTMDAVIDEVEALLAGSEPEVRVAPYDMRTLRPAAIPDALVCRRTRSGIASAAGAAA